MRPSADLMAVLDEIERLGRTECMMRWKEVFGRQPPKHMSIQFMRRALVWQAQDQSTGGLPKEVQKSLQRLARTSAHGQTLRPGTVLVREWNGVSHRVVVTDKGFEYRGHAFRSLSAIARLITGAQWSGPRFFGVNR